MGTAAAIVGGSALVAGSSIFGASKSSSAAKKAAESQADAAAYAADVQKQMYDQTREDQAPWREAGQRALTTYENQVNANDYKNTPGYQWRLEQGARALERGAAAKGGLLSGAEQKALEKYGQNLGTEYYQNWLNQLGGLSGVGQSATTATSNAGTSAARGIAQSSIAGGNAMASGYINQANAMTGAVNGVTSALASGINNYMLYSNIPSTNYASAGWGDAGILAGSGPR